MIQVLTVLVALVCLLLMGVILIQNPKGGGLDSTFGGGGGGNSVLGAAKSTDLIEKLTWGLAITLFVLCIITSLVVQSGGSGNLRDSKTSEIQVSPVNGDEVSTYYYKG